MLEFEEYVHVQSDDGNTSQQSVQKTVRFATDGQDDFFSPITPSMQAPFSAKYIRDQLEETIADVRKTIFEAPFKVEINSKLMEVEEKRKADKLQERLKQLIDYRQALDMIDDKLTKGLLETEAHQELHDAEQWVYRQKDEISNLGMDKFQLSLRDNIGREKELERREADIAKREAQLRLDEESLKDKETNLAKMRASIENREGEVQRKQAWNKNRQASIERREAQVKEREKRVDEDLQRLQRDFESVREREKKLEREQVDVGNSLERLDKMRQSLVLFSQEGGDIPSSDLLTGLRRRLWSQLCGRQSTTSGRMIRQCKIGLDECIVTIKALDAMVMEQSSGLEEAQVDWGLSDAAGADDHLSGGLASAAEEDEQGAPEEAESTPVTPELVRVAMTQVAPYTSSDGAEPDTSSEEGALVMSKRDKTLVKEAKSLSVGRPDFFAAKIIEGKRPRTSLVPLVWPNKSRRNRQASLPSRVGVRDD